MDTLRENSDKTWEEVEEEERFSKQHKKVYATTPKTINEHKT